MTLYHYFERAKGPLLSLSDLSLSKAQGILDSIKTSNTTFAAHRNPGYLERRNELEQLVRERFVSKGGEPIRQTPHYFVVEPCRWLETWYLDAAHIRIPMASLDANTVSFTYGDMFPTFSPRVQDGKEYRNTIYTYNEILRVIEKYGLPQLWNPNGERGPERYIEAHIWSEIPSALILN